MEIKAYAVKEPKNQLEPWNYTSNELNAFDVHIEIDHCGICYSDVHMMDNDWGITAYPIVPGHEIVGHVKELGSQVTHLKKGDIVGVGWQRESCHNCFQCMKGNENYCTGKRGSTIVKNHGGFASDIVLDARFCFPIPTGLDLKKTAPLLCGGITVYHGLKAAGMSSGQNIGVIGIGGLGHMAVQFASKMGNNVTVFTTSKDKTEFAHKLGAESAVLTKEGIPKTLPDGQKLDIILNTVDHPLDWAGYVRLLNVDGTLCFVGNPGNITIDAGLLFQRKKIMGSSIGSRYMITEMLNNVKKYNIGAIIEEFPLKDVNSAITKLKANNIRYRAVLNMK